MEFLRSKWHGLGVLFRDHELRVLSPLSVGFLTFLVSVKYFQYQPYVVIIAWASLVLFSYLFQFLILYDVYFVTIGWLRRSISGDKRHHSLWFLRIITGVLIAIEIMVFGIFFLPSIGILFLASLLVWGGIESVIFAKFAWDFSEKLQRKGFRVVIYIGISLSYAIYLTFMLVDVAPPSITSGINDTPFDWILSLIMFFLAIANMGQVFAPGLDKTLRPLGKRVGWDEVKLRNVVLCILFLAIGFEFFTRGLPALLPGATGEVTTRGYYLLRTIYFWPCLVGGLIRGLLKTKKQKDITPKN